MKLRFSDREFKKTQDVYDVIDVYELVIKQSSCQQKVGLWFTFHLISISSSSAHTFLSEDIGFTCII